LDTLYGAEVSRLNLAYSDIRNRRQSKRWTDNDKQIIEQIVKKTEKGNKDNISRTKYYQTYFFKNVEIEWAFLASMVSRNAGWSMCDLAGDWMPRMLDDSMRRRLFMTYERVNWLIFLDAYPQLLMYEASLQEERPLFYLLKAFNVSVFMELEWEMFWQHKDKTRLNTSLIINEQHVIQKPVIEHPYYQTRVFYTLPYQFQDWLHFSTVLFPTIEGDLFGFSVHGFRQPQNRITLGRRLYWLLFQPHLLSRFLQFAIETEPTGSRYDYENYLITPKRRETPYLRMVYEVVQHDREGGADWLRKSKSLKSFYKPIKIPPPYHLNDWYEKKVRQLQIGILLKELLH
jgi:hypothetical protein